MLLFGCFWGFFFGDLCKRGKYEPEFNYPFISPHPKKKEGALRKADEAENHHFCFTYVKLDMPSYIFPITALKSVCSRGRVLVCCDGVFLISVLFHYL